MVIFGAVVLAGGGVVGTLLLGAGVGDALVDVGAVAGGVSDGGASKSALLRATEVSGGDGVSVVSNTVAPAAKSTATATPATILSFMRKTSS
ncbi:hypothetical protein [Amycolatopsis sp.]|uniref:hypothetical protein n=1 Tax=Amycolatopsis sp. TaxID=37632 RepID=UPI002DF9DD2D|nr:hypothetical protein [Amycolatopsis sp.]